LGSLWHTFRRGGDEPLIQGEAALGAGADSGRPGHAVHAGLRISHWLVHVHTLRAAARAVHVNQIGVAQRGPIVGTSPLRRLTFPVRVARRRATEWEYCAASGAFRNSLPLSESSPRIVRVSSRFHLAFFGKPFRSRRTLAYSRVRALRYVMLRGGTSRPWPGAPPFR
jgi:hypothetical protein